MEQCLDSDFFCVLCALPRASFFHTRLPSQRQQHVDAGVLVLRTASEYKDNCLRNCVEAFNWGELNRSKSLLADDAEILGVLGNAHSTRSPPSGAN